MIQIEIENLIFYDMLAYQHININKMAFDYQDI